MPKPLLAGALKGGSIREKAAVKEMEPCARRKIQLKEEAKKVWVACSVRPAR